MLNMEAISRELFSLLILIMIGYLLIVASGDGLCRRPGRPTQRGGRRRVPRFVLPSFARYALDNKTVQDIMDGSRQFPDSTISIQKFVDLWAVPDQADYVVIEEAGKLAGVVYLKDIRHINKERWGTVVLQDLLEYEPITASPDELLDDVTRRMADGNVTVVPVVDRSTGELVGAVTASDIMASVIGGGKRGAK